MANDMPHWGVWCLLAPSKIHGVGVFARLDIPKGTNLWPDDTVAIRTILKDRVDKLLPIDQKLYHDFAVLENGYWTCPWSFNDMTIAWYLNHNAVDPNVDATDGLSFITNRDIKVGEELTVDYTTYSDQGVDFKP